jgi:hypothetical protein
MTPPSEAPSSGNSDVPPDTTPQQDESGCPTCGRGATRDLIRRLADALEAWAWLDDPDVLRPTDGLRHEVALIEEARRHA